MHTTNVERPSEDGPFSHADEPAGVHITQSIKKVAVATVLAAMPLGLTGCSLTNGFDIKAMQIVASTCPKSTNTELNVYAGLDVSGSSKSKALTAARIGMLKSIVTRVAACRGHLQVSAFTGSTSASQVLFDDDLKPAGATQNAWLRKVPAMVNTTMPKLEAGLTAAEDSLDQNGSDIVGQSTLAAEYFVQRGKARQIQPEVDLLTDGEQSVGVRLTGRSLTAAQATALAAQAATGLSKFPKNTTFVVAGIGKTDGKPASTSYVAGLTAFWKSLGSRLGATTTIAVTDYTER